MCTPNYTRRNFLKVMGLGATGLAYGLAEASLSIGAESNSAKYLLKKQTAKSIYDVRFPNNAFPFGTHVYREPHQDQDELMVDLPLLKKLDFNMIKIQEHWGIDEKREGEIDLSRIERVIAKAKELNLGVYLGLTMEQAPAWMWKKYPDCRLVYANGLPHNDPTQYCTPGDGKPGPCWDHPGVRAAAQRFIAKLIKRLGRFKNIWVWNTWQEIGFGRHNRGGVLEFCYCPYTLKRFREWLKIKYGSLSKLNKIWQSGYGDWEEIEPPRHHTYVPSFIDWRYFMDDVYITRVLQWKTKAIKENDPLHRPVFSHVAIPIIGSGAEWRWARVADFYGNSNYPWPGSAPVEQIIDRLQFRVDYCRCAAGRDRIFWGAEFQGGPYNGQMRVNDDPTAEDIRRWMLAGLAAGMNGISFWNHRVDISWQEGNGYGLLDPRGETTERIEEAARIGRAINRDPEIFSLGKPPQAEVAILINEHLYHWCRGTKDGQKNLQNGIRGYYYRLWRMGVLTDFVEAQELANSGLDGYKMVILPVPLALDAEFFEHLRRYVEKGGVLVSDACPGRFDKYGFCPRAQMVAGSEQVFGVRHKKIRQKETILQGAGPFSGTRLQASFYLQTLTPTSAQPILKVSDEIAGTLNHFGKGKAILLGTFAGQSALSDHFKDDDCFFEKLLAEADVKSDCCGQLLRRRRIYEDRQAWFLINPTEEQIVETISKENFKNIRDLLDDGGIVKQTRSHVTVKVPAGNLCCLVLSK